MADTDYYALIGVERGASVQEIRTKFRQRVLQEHPDKGGDPKKFKQLNKAYNVLSDPEKRKRYDATGSADKTAEEEFVEGFAGGRMHFEPRAREADAGAVVNLSDRIVQGSAGHEDGFAEWLRQRDSSSMILTDKDFMKTHLFNAVELSEQVRHTGPVQHVLGSPAASPSGPVQVQSKRQPASKTVEHDQVLVRMQAVPVDESMVYAGLRASGVCLGATGVGRIEQVGKRIEGLREQDAVLVMPQPSKFSSERPLGTCRTLVACAEEDLLKVPGEVLEELTPEQICLAPTIVSAYTILETYGSRLKPGDYVLLNAAHTSAAGSSVLQLCRLLKLKPLCLVDVPGATTVPVRGEYGSNAAWQDVGTPATAPPTTRAKYERISEWLMSMGAEEVFPGAAALLQWRDRNQRMLPKLALDGVACRDSCEQLAHCLQPGDKDAQIVVYGAGAARPIEISPSLLAAWGGRIVGFNVARWVHALPANAKKMMAILENITKLVRANKFILDTQLFTVGSDSVQEAFNQAADTTSRAQVVLAFPTLQEELQGAQAAQAKVPQPATAAAAAVATPVKSKEEEERERLKKEWLELLFTPKSAAASAHEDEGPLPLVMEGGNTRSPRSLVVWLGDDPKLDSAVFRGLPGTSAVLVSFSWSGHPAGESLGELDVHREEFRSGSWYQRDEASYKNEDLDFMHDVEILGRSLVVAMRKQLSEHGLSWRDCVIVGFGRGANIALYACLTRLFPEQVSAMVLCSPIVMFPLFLAKKLAELRRSGKELQATKLYFVWRSNNRATPATYRQLLASTLRREAPEVKCTSDTLPDGGHAMDAKTLAAVSSILAALPGAVNAR
eukprot:TRINITY_DN25821_c0_g1_i1.p1 TRINITY_DN25821_c0_g1~~TRINITY_DN25821_c0_g1_i1.p1  ORF type:complete len:841 (+),score=192.67 TRINITY_DN25821_c0_g1_i1:160-2682(+)